MLLNQTLVNHYIDYIIQYHEYEELDRLYLQNQLLRLLQASDVTAEGEQDDAQWEPNDYVQHWINEAVAEGQIEDTLAAREILEAQLLDLITPRPSLVNHTFQNKLTEDPKAATDYFYALSKRSHYVKEDAIRKNIAYTSPTSYGPIEVTINLSKPEKSAKDIAMAKQAMATSYPKCALCIENEGYLGSATQAARTNHRVVRMDLDGATWGFQYSPYAYFREHSIVLSQTHTPMMMNRQTFRNLFAFIDQLPHYFIGSNADIPLVGGSILSHNHYQAGRHTFPMDHAEERQPFTMQGYPNVACSRLFWPMSVIRLRGQSSDEVVEAATHILNEWNAYSDEAVSIRAYSDSGERHHTVTPIARYRNGQYEMDVVLRDNQTSERYPDGIFHPHPDVQHIKKENIGLIEVMGTAILPARLKEELQVVKRYLLGDTSAQQDLGVHEAWARDMAQHYDIRESNVDEIIRDEVGRKFTRVLEDAGVFKNTEEGQAAFQRFIDQL